MHDKAAAVKSEVRVGDDIDATIKHLRALGYDVGEKHAPSVNADYYLVLVSLRKTIPVDSAFQETTGMNIGNWSGPSWVVIKADLRGRITALE